MTVFHKFVGLVVAAGLMTLAVPASAQFSVEWVQLGGNFRVAATRAGPPNSPLCVHGLSCACPGSRNFCGQHRNGAEVSFWKDGCDRPPLTIQCVIRPTGAGSLPGGGAPSQGRGGGLASGRYEMKTSAFTAIVDLNVNGNTFSGTADWNLPGQRQDPIINGAIRNDVITFTRLCQAAGPSCVQNFQGRLNGPLASGFWTGSGGKGQIAWTMRPSGPAPGQPVASAPPPNVAPGGGGLAPAPAQPRLQFDKPTAVRKLPPKPGGVDTTEIVCTYFPDFMIRESHDGPTSDNAALVRGSNPPCTAKPVPGEIPLETSALALAGRKESALFFLAMSSNGAETFVVIDATSGRIVLKDGTESVQGRMGIQSAAFENGGLRLHYRRAFNAPCSILQNAPGCWAQMVQAGLLPQDMAQQVPSPQICNAAYQRDKAPRDNPSIVLYQTEIMVYGDGKTQTLSRGPVACNSIP